MKSVLFVLVCCGFVLPVTAQVLDNPNYNVIAANSDSSLCVVQFKKKIGLYNAIEERFEVELGKSKFEYLKGADCFFEIGVKQKLAIHCFIDSTYWSVYEKNGEAYIHFPPPVYEIYIPEIIKVNGVFMDRHSNLSSVLESNQPINWRQIGLKKISTNLVLINNYQNETDLIYFDGSDEVEYFNSGVFNLATSTWLIEPQYQQCFQLNNFIYGVRKKLIRGIDLEQDRFRAEYEYSYDIYEIAGNELKLIYTDLKSIDNVQAAKLLGVDKAEMSTDKIHFIVSKNNKKGLVRFQLFDQWVFQSAEFSYQSILPITADYIGFSPYYKKIGVIYADSIQPVYLYHYVDGFTDENDWKDEARLIVKADKSIEFCSYNSYFLVNEQLRVDYEKKFSLQVYNNPITIESLETNEAFNVIYSIELINDSLVLNNNYSQDIPSQYSLMAIYGDDSIDVEGNVVYGPDEPGFDESCVYDLANNTWFIQPSYQLISAKGSGFLVLEGVRDATTNLNINSFYSYYDFKNNLIISRVKSDELVNNLDNLKYMVSSYVVDSIFRAAAGFDNHNALKENRSNYYYKTGNKLGVFAPMDFGGYFYMDWQTQAKDFMHKNPDVGYEFWLENDSLYLKSEQGLIAEKIQDIKLSYLQDLSYLETYTIFIETDSFQTQHNVLNNIDQRVAFSSFQIKDDVLIINDQNIVDRSCYECMDDRDVWYMEEFIYQTECSSIWKKVNGVWTKMTPYYASIESTPNKAYIVTTGFFKNVVEHAYGNMNGDNDNNINIDERYLLLDSNFNAMNFIDYFDFNLIDDLGFGYKVCLDKGCFFMTYDFKILTDAVWDEFIPAENKNQINAIRRAELEFDEFGDIVFDENGNWKELKPEVIEIISLP